MGIVEIKKQLKQKAAEKLRTEVDNHELGICTVTDYRQAFLVDYSRQIDAAGYLGWLRGRSIRIKLAEQSLKEQHTTVLKYKLEPEDSEPHIKQDEQDKKDVHNIRYTKIVDQPSKIELPKPLLAHLIRKLKEKILDQEEVNLDWKDVNLKGGMLFVLYEVPIGIPPSREHRTFSLFLPENAEEEAVLVDHLRKPRGFRSKLMSWNPFNRVYDKNGTTEPAQFEDLQAIYRIVASCNVYDHSDIVKEEKLPLN